MRATEISEAATQLPIIAQTDSFVWYEADAATVASWYKRYTGGSARLSDAPDARYFVMAPTGQTPLGLNSRAVMQQADDLISVETTAFVTHNDGMALQALSDAIKVKHGERIWGDFILYDGKVYMKSDVLRVMPKVADISTGPVYDIPAHALWTLQKIYLPYKVSADRVVVFRNTTADVSQPWSSASIRAGIVSDIQSQSKLDKVTQVKLGKELSQALNLSQKVTVNTHIIPESKLHDTLRAINDHPDKNYYHLYTYVLNLKKVPKRKSKEDSVSELVQLGLTTEYKPSEMEGSRFKLTPVGRIVLARVNSGKSVAKASLIK